MPNQVQPAYTRQNVLVGQARMFLQKIVTGSVPALPADTVAIGGAWPSAGANIWVPVGATSEGLNFRFQRSTQDINVEEQLTPVAVNTTGLDISMEMVLSEDTVETMVTAYGGGSIVTVAAASGVIGKKTLTIGSDLDNYAFGFETQNQFGFFRRVMVPAVVSVGQAETLYRRAQDARRYAVSLRVLCAPEEIIVLDKTAAALP
jgi:hypothetical protein